MPELKPGDAIIHLIHASKTGKIVSRGHPGIKDAVGGTFDIACTPGSVLPNHATSETVAVTCPLCRETKVFKDLDGEQNVDSLGGSAADRAVAKALLAKAQKEVVASGASIQ